MPNSTVPAAAEGLPAINRRRMLLGLAAASTAAATVTVATAAAPAENPKLLALAAELPAVAAAYHAVNDEYLATYKDWDAKTPWAPDELTAIGTGWPYEVPDQPGEPEKNALGGFLWRKGDDFPRRIVVKAWEIDSQIWEARREKRRAKKAGSIADFMVAETEIARLKKLYAVASAYEDQFREVKAQASAWHKEAYPLKDARHEALEKHVAAIMDEPDFTMEGLIIKAMALAEWDKCGDRFGDKLAFRHGQNWHGQIAESILRHARAGSA